MKSIIKILNMESETDVRIIQEAISSSSGIIASQVSLLKKEVVILYNDNFIKKEKIINLIEDLGYIIQ